RTYPRRSGGSGFNVVLGMWIIISPFVLGFARFPTARWNDIAVGIAVALLAMSSGHRLNIILGAWLILSPFALGFARVQTLLWNNIILGALVMIVAIVSRPAHSAISGSPQPPV